MTTDVQNGNKENHTPEVHTDENIMETFQMRNIRMEMKMLPNGENDKKELRSEENSTGENNVVEVQKEVNTVESESGSHEYKDSESETGETQNNQNNDGFDLKELESSKSEEIKKEQNFEDTNGLSKTEGGNATVSQNGTAFE